MALRATQSIALPAASTGANPVKILPVQYRKQEQPNWCWAACCQMIFNGREADGLTQCAIAKKVLGGDCCNTPDASPCNAGRLPDTAFADYGYVCMPWGGPLSAGDLQSQIQDQSPVEVYLNFGDHAHVALVTGYYDNGEFEVLDPLYGQGPRTYDEICSAYGYGGVWTETYVGLGK